MVSIGRLAKRFQLSRSTLLYYDRIGLLEPSGRSESNYRRYSEEDVQRLEQICMYRRTGLALQEIRRILDVREGTSAAEALKSRLQTLDEEIRLLREQQRVIVDILRCSELMEAKTMNKERWTELMKAAGLDDRDMHAWHREFEALFPRAHQDFLESLGISEEEIRLIRGWSRRTDDSSSPPRGRAPKPKTPSQRE